jgi:hypothetical protein
MTSGPMRGAARRLTLPVRALLAAVVVLATVGCSPRELVVLDGSELITWESAEGGTAGQIIVSITSAADAVVDPDVFGRDAQTSAVLLDADGEPLPGASRIQLHAVPQTLEPGESGYLIADFDVPSTVADIRVEIRADEANPRPRIDVTGFTLVATDDGVGAEGRLEWDGSGSAVARGIALDEDGQPIGFVGTSEVRYDAGAFTMCCFPPAVTRDSIAEVVVFGIQAIGES